MSEYKWPDPQEVRTPEDLAELVADYHRQTGRPIPRLVAAARLLDGDPFPDAYELGGTISFVGEDAEERCGHAAALFREPGVTHSRDEADGRWTLIVPTETRLRVFYKNGQRFVVQSVYLDRLGLDEVSTRELDRQDDQILKDVIDKLRS